MIKMKLTTNIISNSFVIQDLDRIEAVSQSTLIFSAVQ